MICRADYRVHEIAHSRAIEVITDNHYARGMSNTASHIYGLFHVTEPFTVLGAAVFMVAPAGVARQHGNGSYTDVLTLSRFVLVPELPKNAASLLLGAAIRAIRKLNRYTCLVTYADTAHGHTGTIYRATNWQYIGAVRGSPRYIDSKGKQVSTQATVYRTAAEMRKLYRYEGYSTKHKYIYPLTIKTRKSKQLPLFTGVNNGNKQ